MKIADNVAILEIAGAGNSKIIYPTLIWGDGHLVIIDAGYPGQIKEITQAIAGVGFCIENLTEIIITHQDIDHIGCIKDLIKFAPSARVLAHIEEAPYIDGRETPIKLAAMLSKYESLIGEQKEWYSRLKTVFYNKRVFIQQTLIDGDLLTFCGGIEIVHTPGHTPGNICVFLRSSQIMVGGDAINFAEGQITGPEPQHTYDLELGLKSLEKIKSFDLQGVVSYHCGYLKIKNK